MKIRLARKSFQSVQAIVHANAAGPSVAQGAPPRLDAHSKTLKFF
jgi:hypothetical protein